MFWIKNGKTPIVLSLALCLGSLALSWPILVLAKPSNLIVASEVKGRRAGGRRGGECLPGTTSLAAVIPDTPVGLTADAAPTFLFYIPKTIAKEAKFTLRDDQNRQIYQKILNLPTMPGVISLKLPSTPESSVFLIGKNYRWDFRLLCNPEDSEEDVVVNGSIQRIQLSSDLVTRLKNSPERDRVAIYAEAGIWYNAIATLADLRRANPTDPVLTRNWTNLLQKIGLDDIAEAPLIQP